MRQISELRCLIVPWEIPFSQLTQLVFSGDSYCIGTKQHQSDPYAGTGNIGTECVGRCRENKIHQEPKNNTINITMHIAPKIKDEVTNG